MRCRGRADKEEEGKGRREANNTLFAKIMRGWGDRALD